MGFMMARISRLQNRRRFVHREFGQRAVRAARIEILLCGLALVAYPAQAAKKPLSAKVASNLGFSQAVTGDAPQIVAPGSSENAFNGSFELRGDSNASFFILPPSGSVNLVRSGGSETIPVFSFTANPSGQGTLGPNGRATVFVGATLGSISTSQRSGTYSGQFVMTFSY